MSASLTPDFPPALRKAAAYAALILAVFAAYSNAFDNTFVYDDNLLIVGNRFLRSWHSIGTILTTPIFAGADVASHYYRPLQILLYLIIYQLAGLSPIAFHIPGIALHAANACLVYALGRKLGFHAWGVFFAALIWALHPIQVEAVTYMSGTADPLYVFFGLTMLLVLLPDFTPRRFVMAAPLLILALLAKEEAITLPLVAMSCLFYVSEARYSLKIYLRTWPLWLIVAAYLAAHTLFNLHATTHMPDTAHAQRIFGLYLAPPPYTDFAAFAEYLRLLIAPGNLHYDRSFPFLATPWHWEFIAGFALFLLCFYQVFWRQKRDLALSWGILWFAAAYFLHSGIALAFDRPVVEHFMYLPSAGLFLALAETATGILAAPEGHKYLGLNIAAALIIAATMGWRTYEQNKFWRDPETLYLHIFASGEEAPKAHNNLGAYYAKRGETAEALEQYRLATDFSDDTLPEAQYNWALLLLDEPGDHTDQALLHLKRAVEIDPDYYDANAKLAEVYAKRGDDDEAQLYGDRAAAIRKNLDRAP
jgi:tetratricopeptide (TPR) repeat protein